MLYMVHASFTHGVYTYGKVPKPFKNPPGLMADCKARARRWCGCTSAGVDPPGQGSAPTAKTWSKPTNSGEGNAKALSILPLRMCKNMLLIIATRILCLTPLDSSPPHFCASGRHRLGHLSLNRHPAIGNDIAPHYCQQIQRSRSTAGETPFLS